MSVDEILRRYGWAPGIILALLFLLSPAVMRQLRERSAQCLTAQRDDQPTVGPEDFARARQQFILTLALLAIIVIVSIPTHLQSL